MTGTEAAAIGEICVVPRSGVPGAPAPGASPKLLRSGISWRNSTATAPTATIIAPTRNVSWSEVASAVWIAAISASYAWAACGPAALSPSRMLADDLRVQQHLGVLDLGELLGRDDRRRRRRQRLLERRAEPVDQQAAEHAPRRACRRSSGRTGSATSPRQAG